MTTILGKYRVGQRIGGGGMAEVFAGSTIGAEGFSRPVAIKRVLAGFSDNPTFGNMFVAEARISSQLVHPNIVSVLDFDRDADKRLFLVMELVEGCDLDALIATGLLPVPVVIFVISEVLRGLGYAHDLPGGSGVRGVIHRDVSPHNVLVSWEGAVKLSDFGIAKARTASNATGSEFIKGKPAYMSPEQANAQPLDGRSDLFAVGIMLWEMLVGRRLFVGEDTRSTLAAVLFGQIPRPRSLRSELPKDLERVVMKLLERDLPARYPTAEAALDELLECADAPKAGREALIGLLAERFPNETRIRTSSVRGRGASVAPPIKGPTRASIPDLDAARAAPTATGYRRPSGPRKRRGRLLAIAIAGLAAGATLSVVVALALRDSPRPPPNDIVGSAAPRVPADATSGTPEPPPVASDAAIAIEDPPKSDPPELTNPGAKVGYLELRAFPVLSVAVDGKRVGDTPMRIKLSVGKHSLRLRNPETAYDERTVIEIRENQTTKLIRPK
jgi:serine/threonine protein kinase